MDRRRGTADDIPRPVRRFLARCVDTVEQLEIILLLQRHPERSWNALEVGEALGLDHRAVARDLEQLGTRDLLDVRLGADVRYRFSPGAPEAAAAAQRAAEAYRVSRGAVLAFVTAGRYRSLQDFSDAFRLTEDDDDDC
ncbi:MAG TPA: hypothetical protein VHU82_16575 [Vicinamibacterales bacterium]|nr:hypothetical protein [Vicinamibacterales bacterium]